MDVLSPSWLAPRPLERRAPRHPQRRIRLRPRLLTRPVMVALIVSLVWRRMPAVAEVQQVVTRDGWLGMAPLQVSPQALTNRLDGLPAALLGPLCTEVWVRVQAPPPPPLPPPRWAPVGERVPLLALVDGSPLEALRTKAPIRRPREGLGLAGKMMVRVDAFRPRPLWQLYTAEAPANDPRVAAASLAVLPVGGLVVGDLGCCSCPWCDALPDQEQSCVTRLREKTASRPVQGLRPGLASRDESIPVGQYRSHPCGHPVRRVSVLGPGGWSRSRTHVLTPQVWSARQVCALSRRRWRSEEAVALTKRRLAWADVWTGSTHAVPWQIDATLMFYAVLVAIGQQVAQALGEPLERISVEMVCRAFSHDRRAVQHGECDELVPFLVEHAQLLGLVKRWRTQHRERQHLESLMWGDP
jgi:hypothetical protein